MTSLCSLHIAPNHTPWPSDLLQHFPNLRCLIIGDLLFGPCWPPFESLAACPHLACLCLAVWNNAEFLGPPLNQISTLTALRQLELCGTLTFIAEEFEEEDEYEDDWDWYPRCTKCHRCFSQFKAAVRAPALTRLVLRHASNEHLREAADGDAGWPCGREAVVAALQAASPAGAALQVVIDDDEDWRPCLLPRSAYRS